MEAFLHGSQANSWLTIDDVFDPVSGKLWEQFQSTTPPGVSATGTYAGTNNPYYDGFVSSPVYITQFAGSPNWDYLDWGSASLSDTEVWVDYFCVANYSGFGINSRAQQSADAGEYGYQFVNGSTLDLMYLPGVVQVDLNSLGTIIIDSQTIASGFHDLTGVDAAGASGMVTLIGLTEGDSTLIGGTRTHRSLVMAMTTSLRDLEQLPSIRVLGTVMFRLLVQTAMYLYSVVTILLPPLHIVALSSMALEIP